MLPSIMNTVLAIKRQADETAEPSEADEASSAMASCTMDTCSVEDSIYGYIPGQSEGLFFLIGFLLLAGVHILQSRKTKSWAFVFFEVAGSVLEAGGYGARLALHKNVFNYPAFKAQLVLLTVAPAFISGGYYLTLKHIVNVLGPQFSQLRPAYYTWIFMTCDIISIIVQMGGAILAAQGKYMVLGNDIMMGGLSLQVFTLVIFGVLAALFFARATKHRREWSQEAKEISARKTFKGFLAGIAVGYLAVLVRCCYRIAEMSGGWANPLMRNERDFVIMDGVMCLVAVAAMNIWHPDFVFKKSLESAKYQKNENGRGGKSGESGQGGKSEENGQSEEEHEMA